MNADHRAALAIWLAITLWVAIGCGVQTWKERRR